MNNFITILKSYLAKKTVNQALLINGRWGSGKTYFFKEKVKELVEHKIIYISIYGIGNVEDLFSQIVVQKYGLVKKLSKIPGSKVAAGLIKSFIESGARKFGLPSPSKSIKLEDLISFKENELLVIDDLERRDPAMDIESLLGFVNTNFTEHNKIKVILICDEDELIKRLDDSERNRYLSIKEKAIWRTQKFQQVLKDVLPEIISKYVTIDKEFHHFAIDKIELLDSLYYSVDLENLRWIDFHLEILYELYTKIDQSLFQKLELLIITTSLILVKEYKSGRLDHEYAQSGSIAYLSSFVPSKQYETALTEQQRQMCRYYDGYFSNLHPLNRLVREGVLNLESLVEMLNEILKTKDEKTAWNSCLDAVRQFRHLTQPELQTNYSQCLKYVEEGKYDVQSLITLVNFSTYFIENRFITSFDEVSSLVEFLMQHVDKATVSTVPADNRLLEIDPAKINKYPSIQDLVKLFEEKYRLADKLQYEIEANKIIDQWIDTKGQITTGAAAYSIVGASKAKLDALAENFMKEPRFADDFYYKISRDRSTLKNKYKNDETAQEKIKYLISRIKYHIGNDKIKCKLLEDAFGTADISVS